MLSALSKFSFFSFPIKLKNLVKKFFNERAQQLQKENIKKSQLQQREEELSDLEMERDELLLIEKRDEQQNIGE